MGAMKDVIPCHSCASCAIGFGTGFAGTELLRCSRMQCYVTRDDGCTMGEPGEPGSLCFDWDVTIEGHAAVWGCA